MFRSFVSLFFIIPLLLSASTHEQAIQKELQLLNLPSFPWRGFGGDVCDVAIVGAGQAGISIAYALELEGLYNVKVFDLNPSGEEGPWLTTARMRSLRSGKQLRGPVELSSHTFRAWHEANYGEEAWDSLGKWAPTEMWGKYLQWLKAIQGVNVNNCRQLKEIIPNPDNTLTLHFDEDHTVRCRKVVLATGRMGFGGAQIPDFVSGIPKKFWAHTSERMAPEFFKNKRVAVIGVGASGFDSAAIALENGAKSVQMLMRRATLPQINYGASFGYPGFMYGFYYLTDKERCEYFTKLFELGVPPTQESMDRLNAFPTFKLVSSCQPTKLSVRKNKVVISTNQGPIPVDSIILATGYAIDGSRLPELANVHDKILLWEDRVENISPKLGKFPYLGPRFEFMEKIPGTSPYLANIHCFNYGGFLSHGRICGDIDAVRIGIRRLVEGICIDLFLQDTCRNGEPIPTECPGACQSGLCSFQCKDAP